MESNYTKVISDLERKVKKYEVKMRDLIEAYKCIVKEKETLEKTVESFSRQQKLTCTAEGSPEVDRMQSELTTLSTSIASLTEERRRMERSYLEDKRVMRTEYESNLKAVRSELEAQSIVTDKLRDKLKAKTINMEKNDENLIQRDYQMSTLNDECARLRLELSSVHHERTLEKNGYEFRIAQLEETVADISRNIGKMEKQHLCDSEMIIKLTDRVQGLLGECKLTTKLRETAPDTPDILQFQDYDKGDCTATVKAIVDRIRRLRTQLQDMNPSVDIGEEWGPCIGGGCVCPSKVNDMSEGPPRAETTLQSMSSSAMSLQLQQEYDRVKEDLAHARTRIQDLQEELSSMDGVANERERVLRESMAKAERGHRVEVTKVRQEHTQAMMDLQAELTKHRNRTIGLLTEKEDEVQSLQRALHTRRGRTAPLTSGEDASDSPCDQSVDSGGEVTSPSSYDSSCPLYQCCETKARMDQELRRLRHQRRQLEVTVHRMEADGEYSRCDWDKERSTLRDRLQQAEAINKLSSSINMEYLRNVFLRFLTTSDSSCKYLMAKAIGKVLQISAKELKAVEKSFQKNL